MKSRHCAATNALREKKTAAGLVLVVGAILLAAALPAQAQTGGNTDKPVPPAKSAKAGSAPSAAESKSQVSYALGLAFGSQLRSFGLNASLVQFDRVIQGFRDALAGKATVGPEDEQRIQGLLQQARTSQGAANEAAAEKFLASNGKQPGVMTTASGLEYKVIRPGSGESPKPTDEATVNYRGTLLDGTVFDDSYKRGQPATFPVGQVIKGWQEALQLMKPGEKIELYIPPALGYGMTPPPGAPIPPGALLKFEVELLSVKPAPAAPAAGAAPKRPSK